MKLNVGDKVKLMRPETSSGAVGVETHIVSIKPGVNDKFDIIYTEIDPNCGYYAYKFDLVEKGHVYTHCEVNIDGKFLGKFEKVVLTPYAHNLKPGQIIKNGKDVYLVKLNNSEHFKSDVLLTHISKNGDVNSTFVYTPDVVLPSNDYEVIYDPS